MKRLVQVPHGIQEIKEFYGDPAASDLRPHPHYLSTHTVTIDLPFPMRLSWCPSRVRRRVLIHHRCAESLLDALKEILKFGGHEFLVKNEYDLLGGTYNFRVKRGGNELSTHAWPIAIDLNPHLGPFGSRIHKQPQFIIDAFTRRGWENLEHDRMHFQACTGY